VMLLMATDCSFHCCCFSYCCWCFRLLRCALLSQPVAGQYYAAQLRFFRQLCTAAKVRGTVLYNSSTAWHTHGMCEVFRSGTHMCDTPKHTKMPPHPHVLMFASNTYALVF
jgi:hypothetical protein